MQAPSFDHLVRERQQVRRRGKTARLGFVSSIRDQFGRLLDWMPPGLATQAASEPQNATDEPSGDRPACAREEADAKPDADLVKVDDGRHVGFSLHDEAAKLATRPVRAKARHAGVR
jgi:hypothetical protein